MKTNFRISRQWPDHVSRTGLLTLSLVAAGLSSCKKPEAVAPPPPVVEVMEIKPSDAPLSTTLIGQLDSPQNVEVRARVEAFVDDMNFIEGAEVKAGDVLFKLDRKPLLEKLDAANGALGEAEAALHKYRTDVARLTPLYEKRAIPKQDLDNALASVDVGEAGVVTAKARVESAKIDLEYCEVKAPITGLIGAKQVSIGELVGKGEPTLLATMSTLDPIWFYCNVSEVEYMRAQVKSQETGKEISKLPLSLSLGDGKVRPDLGKFVFIDRAVDAKTGTLRIRAEFPNKDKLLRPGMFARVNVDLGVRKDSILIPERALLELQGKTFVWVVGQDAKASQRPVQVGEQVGSTFVILEGLQVGERIIVEGLQKAREGAAVNPKTAVQLAETASAAPVEKAPSK
ncbi:efflux RND transporter periplasmic adaptor subunit [Luteolibacter yonseiensis]|uniref:Efflux RND transporter periplasmic adaptor subunit n=1 Tax=Luteolibacter yonseiensis TaxID=1144680 RepID=A0A934R1T9_9BACT|nr:efflux RND transporter periplasmic adaptor subunit [Luteolibacter yonseiensis]MBK1814573.1 efflux RND transporter periplasmic adaptor subunit [Luteolibacter yonseiensis]